jgi:predicted transposase YbfD/YdcC
METACKIIDCFANVETSKEHNGYFCSVGNALKIVVLGSFCGLRNTSQVHQWASDDRVKEVLSTNFGIKDIPCYYWLLSLLKLILPKSLNQCFIHFVQSLVPDGLEGLTVSFDGKTIRSTGKMEKYPSAMHIVSAHIAELGITFGQQTVYEKSNEIPAVRELIEMLELTGCIVVADALNCQKETAKAIIDKDADYLLSVKDNHKRLKQDIEKYIQDESFQQNIDTKEVREKNRGRIEYRKAFITTDIEGLHGKDDWANLACIGAINTQFTTKNETTNEWHYYISSKKMTAEELLKYARAEWSVETMHWLLDVHFCEDFCRVQDKNVQQNLNMSRKLALNGIKYYKKKSGDKRPISKIMMDCLLQPEKMLLILCAVEN